MANLIAIREIRRMEQSNQIDLQIWQLPTPPYIEASIRGSDVKIIDALIPLNPFRNTKLVYLALLLKARGTANKQHPYVYPQIGYIGISKLVRERWHVRICKRSVQYAIDRLVELKYVQCSVEARLGKTPTAYAVLTCPAVMRMMQDAGCTYCRLLEGKKIQLIRPI